MRTVQIVQLLYAIALAFALHLGWWVLANLVGTVDRAPLWYAPLNGLIFFWPLLITFTYPVFWLITLRRPWGAAWVVARTLHVVLAVVLLGVMALLLFVPWLGGSWT